MKTIKGDLVLKEDAHYKESLMVEGSIKCEGGLYNLEVDGDIDARDIDALDIYSQDIHARDIDARDIHAGDIDARNIDAWDINVRKVDAEHVLCEKITLKKGGRVKATSLTEDRSRHERRVLKEAT